jgi:hydroxybutyrate-dimer hydrolase
MQSRLALAAVAAAVLAACGGGQNSSPTDGTASIAAAPRNATAASHWPFNEKPSWLGTIRSTDYDGESDDLLTAGLGTSGLMSAVAPGYVDALNPTAAELRRNTIYNNYRALVDATSAGGFGRFYGPNVIDGVATSGEG